jgi:hypothetical protein
MDFEKVSKIDLIKAFRTLRNGESSLVESKATVEAWMYARFGTSNTPNIVCWGDMVSFHNLVSKFNSGEWVISGDNIICVSPRPVTNSELV